MSGMDPAILTNNGTGLVLSCSDVSTRGLIVGTGDSLIISNISDVVIFLKLGGSTITATTSGYPLFPMEKEDELLLDVTASWYATPYAAAICQSGETGTLLVHRVFR